MKYLAIALGALVLGGCAGTRTSIPTTSAAAEAPEPHVALVRLRSESRDDGMQRAACDLVARLLAEENYEVAPESATVFDVDMILATRTREDATGKHTTITLTSMAGRRVLAPHSAEFVSNDGSIDEPTLVDLWMSWKRGYVRWTQAVRRHREMVSAAHQEDLGPPSSAAKPAMLGALE
jgi:hypothetical protein